MVGPPGFEPQQQDTSQYQLTQETTEEIRRRGDIIALRGFAQKVPIRPIKSHLTETVSVESYAAHWPEGGI